MAYGLSYSGVRISVLNIAQNKKEYDQFISMFSSSLNYYYDPGPKGALYDGRNKIIKLFNNAKLSIILAAKLIKISHFRKAVIIIPRDCIEIAIIAVFIKKIFSTKLISNIMEYSPSLSLYKNKLRERICWKLILKHSDGYILISRFLVKVIGRHKPTFYLPAIIDTQRKVSTKKNMSILFKKDFDEKFNYEFPVFLYTSSCQYGELLEFCLKALMKIRNKNFILFVTGSYPEYDLFEYQRKIKDYGLSGKVKFTGFLEEAKFDELKCKSKALLIPLLNNSQHNARFPQKILEYMLLRKAIISTDVGEVGEYFTDGIDAFLDKTITHEGFANKIVNVIENDNLVTKVNKNAVKKVIREFDSVKWGKRLKSFIEKL